MKKPLTIEADITTADLLEVAGKKILVKLGEVIGPQEEMYQEKARQLPLQWNIHMYWIEILLLLYRQVTR
ncbi:MAG: hypothetical protein WDM90_14975 [Ferruginibacter sp.]